MNRKIRLLALILTVIFFVSPQAGRARSAIDPASMCDQAAKHAAKESGVPYFVLRAISRTETGRKIDGILQPWAWAVNVDGAGHWFETKSDAKEYVSGHLRQGRRSIDIGCFQVNFHWHGHAFRSLDEMLDPLANARYAAEFLAKLFRETGAWSRAVGAYHSRTEKYAKRYVARFNEVVAESHAGSLATSTVPSTSKRQNGFPFLRGNAGSTAMGSLVPLGGIARRTLFDTSGGQG